MVWAEGVSRGPVSQGKGSFSFFGFELGVSAWSAEVMARVHRASTERKGDFEGVIGTLLLNGKFNSVQFSWEADYFKIKISLFRELLGDFDRQLDEDEEDQGGKEDFSAGDLGVAVLFLYVAANPDHERREEAEE